MLGDGSETHITKTMIHRKVKNPLKRAGHFFIARKKMVPPPKKKVSKNCGIVFIDSTKHTYYIVPENDWGGG